MQEAINYRHRIQNKLPIQDGCKVSVKNIMELKRIFFQICVRYFSRVLEKVNRSTYMYIYYVVEENQEIIRERKNLR
jgi:hypothetical protein